jgi:hypothetical protein
VTVADTDVFLDFLEGEGAHARVAALLRAVRHFRRVPGLGVVQAR